MKIQEILEKVIGGMMKIGTPLCVTVDFDTLDDGTVTVRDRDTMEQTRMDNSKTS